MNVIAKHIRKLLAERLGVKTRAELIADRLVDEALKGDLVAIKIVLDALERHDPISESAWNDDDED